MPGPVAGMISRPDASNDPYCDSSTQLRWTPRMMMPGDGTPCSSGHIGSIMELAGIGSGSHGEAPVRPPSATLSGRRPAAADHRRCAGEQARRSARSCIPSRRSADPTYPRPRSLPRGCPSGQVSFIHASPLRKKQVARHWRTAAGRTSTALDPCPAGSALRPWPSPPA